MLYNIPYVLCPTPYLYLTPYALDPTSTPHVHYTLPTTLCPILMWSALIQGPSYN